MRIPLMERLRGACGFVRLCAALVITALLHLSLQPLVLAAQQAPTPRPAATTPAPSDEERLYKALLKIEEKLAKFIAKLTAQQDASLEDGEVKELHKDLKALDARAIQAFDAIEQNLKAKGLPPAILNRHSAAVAAYRADFQTLDALLTALAAAATDADRKLKAEQAKKHLEARQKRRPHQPFDPNNLPTRALTPNKSNKPRLRTEQFRAAGLHDHPTVKLAAHGVFRIDQLPGASDPAYLASTPEVVLSNAIRAKAAELEHNPLKIYNWVYAHTNWLPTWGAIQNSDTALLTRKGNAFDLASLLIALLRASDIPARYVHGTIEVPAERFMNWAGGFTNPASAQNLASAAGIPISAVTSGGTIVAFRLEHVWVEAAIDFYPSGGAINRSADSWVALDPSFKQYVTERGYDMHARLNFNGEQFLMDYLLNGADKTPYQHYSKKVLDYLKANQPDWTLEGLYGRERIEPLKPTLGGDLRELATSLPYKVFARGYTAAAIPDPLRHKVTIEVSNNPTLGADASYTVALSELGLERLTLSYIPETAADDAVVSDYGSLFASPAYLVRVKPVLRRAGTTVAVGVGTTLGETQTLTLSFQTPTTTIAPVVNLLTAGSYSAIVFQGTESAPGFPSLGMQHFYANVDRNLQGTASFDDLLGQLLYNIGLLWFYDLVYERDFYATTTQVAYARLPSQAIATADATVSYWFGIPRSATPGPFTFDADRDVLAVSPLAGDTRRAKDFLLLAGMTGSAQEHLIYEGFIGTPSASAVKALRLAVDQGATLYSINGNNVEQILPLLSLDSDDVSTIRNAVNAGLKVTAASGTVLVGLWRGIGYIVHNPVRGDGLYLISGGLAGGVTFTQEEWDKKVYDNVQTNLLARRLVIGKAREWIGTAYGWGCKDPALEPVCEKGTAGFWIDCSGMVASAYNRVGYPYFAEKNAQMQWDFIGSLPRGRYPTLAEVDGGDMIFWYGTNTRLSPLRIDHVGIVTLPSTNLASLRYIASDGFAGLVAEFSVQELGQVYVTKFHGFGSVLGDLPTGVAP